ncbi:hypothetical protein EKK58_06080 [Candidatus Dependentiae bacterium]|nr:MAG: hypothetical protein EKK58_06080 [Candidatus Dependentiae bacterium]
MAEKKTHAKAYKPHEIFSCKMIVLVEVYPQSNKYRQILLTDKESSKINSNIQKLANLPAMTQDALFSSKGSKWTINIKETWGTPLQEYYTDDEIIKYKYDQEEDEERGSTEPEEFA